MEHREESQTKVYIKKADYRISGLQLRLRYMVEDYDKLIEEELNNRKFLPSTG